jgi:hypothetical protein
MSDAMVLEQGSTGTLGEAELYRLRWVAIVGLVVLNIMDLVLTRRLLSGGATEANPLMALVIAGNWGIAIKIGVPLLAGARHLRVPLARKPVLALCWMNVLYLGVVAWNFHVMVHRIG